MEGVPRAREGMIEAIRGTAPFGFISVFVGITSDMDPHTLSDNDKEHLSAIRVTAGEIGYHVGTFRFTYDNPDSPSNTLTAEITTID